MHVLHPIDEPRAGDRVGEVVLFDERGDRQGDRGAESAVFDVDRDRDAGIVLRCERQEGRMVASLRVRWWCQAACQAKMAATAYIAR